MLKAAISNGNDRRIGGSTCAEACVETAISRGPIDRTGSALQLYLSRIQPGLRTDARLSIRRRNRLPCLILHGDRIIASLHYLVK
jgi:hypothetical protein